MSRPSLAGVGAAAVGLLGANLKRVLRESMALRALAFPVILTILTLLATLAVVSLGRGTPVVAFQEVPPDEVAAALITQGMRARQRDDVRQALVDGDAIFGVAADRWYTAGGRDAVVAEGVLRDHVGARWKPVPPPLPGGASAARQGSTVANLLIAIYALYGVVFGAGMVARDREDGTLEVELTLALPKSLHGLTRWVAATLVIGSWVALATLYTAALLGLPDPGETLRHGVAAAGASVALGLASVRRAGLRSGFAATLAAGLSATTAMLGLGYLLPSVGSWLPLASLASGGTGWAPLVGMVLLGLASVGLFTWRSARA